MDERLNDYSTILTWPDEESGEHSSSLLDIVLEIEDRIVIGLRDAALSENLNAKKGLVSNIRPPPIIASKSTHPIDLVRKVFDCDVM